MDRVMHGSLLLKKYHLRIPVVSSISACALELIPCCLCFELKCGKENKLVASYPCLKVRAI